jgi:hypothetical protein
MAWSPKNWLRARAAVDRSRGDANSRANDVSARGNYLRNTRQLQLAENPAIPLRDRACSSLMSPCPELLDRMAEVSHLSAA